LIDLSTDTTRARRNTIAVLLAITILAGLASRRFRTPIAWSVQKEFGDVLWAVAAYWGVAIIRPNWPRVWVAVLSFALACASEASQLNHAHWIQSLRSWPIGHLLLGSGFSWLDMAMYLVGVIVAYGIDRVWIAGRVLH